MLKHKQNEKGFTLVEPLIVVAIIGILAAIAIPQYTKYKVNAAEATAEANLKNCVTQLSAAYSVNGTSTWDCVIGDATSDNLGLTVNTDGSISSNSTTGLTVEGIESISCGYNGTPIAVNCNQQ